MNTIKKIGFILAATVLGAAIIACSLGSVSPIPTETPPALTNPISVTEFPPTPVQSMPELEGYSLPFYDDFSNPASGWEIYTNEMSGKGYENGYYYVSSLTKGLVVTGGIPNGSFGDTHLEVDAIPAIGPGNNNFGYGAGCRTQSNSDGYVFIITANGYYSAGYYTNEGQTYIPLSGNDWQTSSAILQGNVNNHIAVTCNGNSLRFSVNNQILYEGQDSTYTDGYISLSAVTYEENAPIKVYFDNIIVTLPSAEVLQENLISELVLINSLSSRSICYVFIKPSGSDNWGENWLGSNPVNPGEEETFSVTAGIYDLKADDCNQKELVMEQGVDLISGSKEWELSDQ